MKLKQFLLLVSSILILTLFLTACGQQAAEEAPAKPAEEQASETEEPASTEAEATEKDSYQIAGITFYSDFFMQTVIAGMELSAGENNVEFSNHVSELDLEKETQIIEDLITKGVDAILITPVSADGSTAALKQAKDAGITVVCFNTCVNEEGIASAFLYTEGQDHGAQTGKAVAKYIADELGGSAKMGVLNCEAFELCVERMEGFMAELEGLDVEIIDSQLGYVADEAVTIAEDMLQAHPEIDIMFSQNEGGTVGIVQAVKSMGLEGEMPVFGLDINLQLAQMLQSDDGILQATTGQSPYELGYLSMNTAVDALNGKAVDEVVFSPAIFFDRDNPAKAQQFIDTEGQALFSLVDDSEATEDSGEMMDNDESFEIAGVTFYSDFFMQTVIAGMELSASENNVEFSNHVSELDLEKETQIIEDLITKGVDAILITPVSADGSTAALKLAKDAGITIVCFNTCVNEEGIASAFLYTEGQDHGAQTGKAVAKYIADELGGSAKMGVLNCEAFELCVERMEGFMAELEGLDVEIVDSQLGYVADEAVTIAEDMLQAHPEINLMFSQNEGGTVGIVQAVKSMGLTGEVPVFGLDINLQLAQMLQSDDSILQATTGQSPYELGYLSMNTAVDALNGKAVDEVVFSPAIFFERSNPAKTQQFIDTEGQALFSLADDSEAMEDSGEAMSHDTYQVAGITFYSDFFMQTVVAGMELAAGENNVEFTNHVSELDLEKEADIIEDLITKGVDAILITPVSSDGSTAALKRAKEEGITVVCFNTCVNEEGIASSFLYTEGQDHGAQTGKAVAEYIADELGGSAKMGILNCETFELCVERLEGFMAELEGLDVEIVDSQLGFVADEAVTVAEDMLQAHPEIDIMWSENEGGTVGIVQAVKSMGLQGEMPVYGLDMNLQLGQMLQADDGILLGTTGQSPYDLGYLTMETAVDVLNGKEVELVVFSPAVYFDRNDPDKTQEFIDTQGQTLFK